MFGWEVYCNVYLKAINGENFISKERAAFWIQIMNRDTASYCNASFKTTAASLKMVWMMALINGNRPSNLQTFSELRRSGKHIMSRHVNTETFPQSRVTESVRIF